MPDLTPRQIVEALNRYIVGQRDAKRAVAIALRNRWRRQQLAADLKEEVSPKNIIMIGPTGVGKTEIARRLAALADAPFLKIEASKFTEVGYVGKDVDSMIRDLAEIAVSGEREKERVRVEEKARQHAEERLLDLLLPKPQSRARSDDSTENAMVENDQRNTREKLRALLQQGKLDEREVEIEVNERNSPHVEILGAGNMEEMGQNLREMLGNFMPQRQKQRKVKVPEAMKILTQTEASKLIDLDKVIKQALVKVENAGIIFLDEIDKIAGRETGHGPDVSRQGVQRDILPIVEGATVATKYGPVRTNHILFIAAGAFHVSKPSDLIPEMQGRFPIRVELKPLSQQDFVRILTEPECSLTKQYEAMLRTEGITLQFEQEAVEELALLAAQVNSRSENIGARRLHTIMEKLLEDLSFEAPEMGDASVVITKSYVHEKLGELVRDQDLSSFIL